MYKNMSTLIATAKKAEQPLHKIILESEMRLTGATEELIYTRVGKHLEVMRQSAQKALKTPQEMFGALISGQSSKQAKYASTGTLSGKLMNNVMAMAMSSSEVNASMGRVCAAPTAGACGILPAVIINVGEMRGSSNTEMLDALIVAGGIGAIIARNATLSGAEGGCQAECGAAAAMAAGAAVYLSKGSAEQVEQAVSIALINCMGLVCDPVAGLVQLPCSFRNASQAANALISADMALANQNIFIAADEIIDAMYRVGKRLPFELKETSLGGIAITPSARLMKKQLFQNENK